MSYGSYSDGSFLRYHISTGVRKPPFSNPPSYSSQTQVSTKSTSRTGTNSPYIKGGVVTVMTSIAVPYRTVVGHYKYPVRIKQFYWDKKAGRRRFRWVITYRSRKVFGTKVRIKRVPIRVPVEGGLLLKPNRLSYDASLDTSGSSSSNWIINSGLPNEIASNVTQAGRTIGRVSGGGSTTVSVGTSSVNWPSVSQKVTELDKQALSLLYSRVNEEYTNVALIVAESGKTFNTLTSIFFSGIALAKSLKRLELDKARRILIGNSNQDLANRWLAFQYGVRPLLSDAKSLMDDISREAKAYRKYTGVRSGSVSKQEIVSGTALSTTTWDYTIDITVKHSVICNTNLQLGRMGQKLGFTNVVGLAYEMVPFSFVLDWFYGLGNYLNSCRNFNSEVAFYWKTTTILYSASSSVIHHPGAGWYGGGSGPDSSILRFTCDRIVPATVPSLPLPSINRAPFNLTRALSALSLYLQRR